MHNKIKDLESRAKHIQPSTEENPLEEKLAAQMQEHIDKTAKPAKVKKVKTKQIKIKSFSAGDNLSVVKPHTISNLRIHKKDPFEIAIDSLLSGGEVSEELSKNDYKKLFSYLHVTNNKMLEGRVIDALAKKTKMGKTIINQAFKQYEETAKEQDKEKKAKQALTTYRKIFKELDDIELPIGYMIDGDYIVHQNMPVCKIFTISSRVVIDDEVSECYYEIKKIRGHVGRKLLVPATVLTNHNRVAELFANTGEIFDTYKAKLVSSFISEYTRINEDAIEDKIGRETVGWFDGEYYLPQLDQNVIWIEDHKMMQKRFKKKGKIENQVAMIREMMKGKIGVLTLASLASSVFGLIDDLHLNFNIHVGGSRGDGKSLAIKAAVSLYGQPNKHYGLGWDNTTVACEQYLQTMHHAPSWLDDTETAKRLSDVTDILYSFGNGIGRGRGFTSKESKVGLRKLSYYEGILFSTGEKSIKDIIDINAGLGVVKKEGVLRRTIDLKSKDLWNGVSKKKIGTLLDSNYGTFISKWTELLKEEKSYIEERFLDLAESLDIPDLEGKEQIYYLLIVVLEILQKHNIIDKGAYELQTVFINNLIRDEKAIMVESKDIVSQFTEKFGNYIAKNIHQFLTPTQKDVHGIILGKLTVNEAHIPKTTLEEFCTANGIPFSRLIDSLKDEDMFLLNSKLKHMRTIRLREFAPYGVVFKRDIFDLVDSAEDFHTYVN